MLPIFVSHHKLQYCSHSSWVTVLPIGVMFNNSSLSGDSPICMSRPEKCSRCSVLGLPFEVEMHKRLEHSCHVRWGNVQPIDVPRQNPWYGGVLAAVLVPEELKASIRSATKVFGREEHATPGESEYDGLDHVWTSCDIVFAESECKVTVDVTKTIAYGCSWGNIRIFAHLRSCRVPFELLNVGTGENIDAVVGDKKRYHELFLALGLSMTSPSHLIAMLVLEAFGVSDFVDNAHHSPSVTDDVLKEACTLLDDAIQLTIPHRYYSDSEDW